MSLASRTRLTGLTLALGLTCLAACEKSDSGGEEQNQGKPAPSDKDGADAEPSKKAGDDKAGDDKADDKAGDDKADDNSATAPTNAGPAGPAYFGIMSKGIAKLDDSGWSMLVEDTTTMVSSMFIGPDGTPHVLKFDGLFTISDGKLEQVVEFDYRTFGSATSIAVAKDGSYWAPGFKGVGLYRDGKWTVIKNEEIDSDINMFISVAVGSDGIPWFGSAKDYYYRQGESWKKADLSAFGSQPFFAHLSASPSGEVYATTGRELARFKPEGVEKITIEGKGGLLGYSARMAYGPDGSILLASMTCDLAVVHPDRPDQVRQLDGDSYDCAYLTGSALDGQGRAWIGSREGLSVVAADGTVTEYPTGSVPELIGLSTNMMVVGAGPKLPEAGPVQTGPVTGKALIDGTPVANAEIEMCTSPQMFAPTSPCDKAKVKFSGTTNDKGEFTFDKVPLGDFNIAVKLDTGWQTGYTGSYAVKRKPGQSYDIGAVKFHKR